MRAILRAIEATFGALCAFAACGGNLKPDAGTSSGSTSSATTGTTSTVATSSAGDCMPKDCAGLGADADAKIYDGREVGRTVCKRVGAGCGWDFPDCAAVPVAMDASAGPSRRPTTECPLISPRDPGAFPGACSFRGRWSIISTHGNVQSAGVIEFDPDGTYYGGPVGTNLSQWYAYNGAYAFLADGGAPLFFLVYSCGDGCPGEGIFEVEFRNACTEVTLRENVTACTGNRNTFAGTVVLVRQ